MSVKVRARVRVRVRVRVRFTVRVWVRVKVRVRVMVRVRVRVRSDTKHYITGGGLTGKYRVLETRFVSRRHFLYVKDKMKHYFSLTMVARNRFAFTGCKIYIRKPKHCRFA